MSGGLLFNEKNTSHVSFPEFSIEIPILLPLSPEETGPMWCLGRISKGNPVGGGEGEGIGGGGLEQREVGPWTTPIWRAVESPGGLGGGDGGGGGGQV